MDKKLLSQNQRHQHTSCNSTTTYSHAARLTAINTIDLEAPTNGVCCGKTILYDNNIPAHALISGQAFDTPDKIALVFENIRISYKELDERSYQLALYLAGKGIGKQDVVALAIDRTEH